MLKIHSTGASQLKEVFFPNNLGALILKSPGESEELKVAMIKGTEDDYDIDPSTLLTTDEIGCTEMLDKIRNLCPD